jgi:hypothetical protein
LNPFLPLRPEPNGYFEFRGTLTGVAEAISFYRHLQKTMPNVAEEFYFNPGYQIDLNRVFFSVGHKRRDKPIQIPHPWTNIGLDSASKDLMNAQVFMVAANEDEVSAHDFLILTGASARMLQRELFDHFYELSFYKPPSVQ